MKLRTSLFIILTAAAAGLSLHTVLADLGEVVAAPRPVAIIQPAQPVPVKKPIVQIAILLDTSSSMDGLIGQAKTQLWKIVNEFVKAKRDGQAPDIEVALYHYGTPSLGAENGYIKQLVPLSNDLDKVSEELFKLKTDGGDEFCGAVIKKAAEELKWSTDKDAYKAIFIAGNEPFTQGTVDYRDACKEAIGKGIIVNTIHCGSEQDGISGHWKDGAALADGSFMCINMDKKIVQLDAPQDKEIAELSAKINTTYVAYGQHGAEGAQRQVAQDANAVGAGTSVNVERAASKAGAGYRNSTWDLTDATKDGTVKLADVKESDLPPEMKKMNDKERETYIAEKQKERADIQAKIQILSNERAKYIAEKAKTDSGDKTLDAAIIEVVKTQAERAHMNFDK